MINSSKITTVLFTISLTVILFSCKDKTKSTTDETYTAKQEIDWTQAHEYYLQHIKKTHQYLDSLNQTSPNSQEAKNYFIKARQAFKEAEPYASYLNPEVGHQANGPALPRLTDDTQRVLLPIGFQKIEESIYEGGVAENDSSIF